MVSDLLRDWRCNGGPYCLGISGPLSSTHFAEWSPDYQNGVKESLSPKNIKTVMANHRASFNNLSQAVDSSSTCSSSPKSKPINLSNTFLENWIFPIDSIFHFWPHFIYIFSLLCNVMPKSNKSMQNSPGGKRILQPPLFLGMFRWVMYSNIFHTQNDEFLIQEKKINGGILIYIEWIPCMLQRIKFYRDARHRDTLKILIL